MATLYFTQSSLVLNWASASSWTPAQVPILGDYCIFNSVAATCSLNTIGTCSQIDFTNYTRQFRFNTNALQVYGTISFGNQMSFSFSTTGFFNGYNLVVVASSSITTNGCTVGVPFGLYNRSGNNYYTIVDNLNCGENFSTGALVGALTHTINGATISLYKNFGINVGSVASATLTTGSSNIVMLGTGTITSAAASSGGLANNFTIAGTGTITIPINIYYRTGTFSIVGTPTISGSGYVLYTGAGSFIAASSSSTYNPSIGISTGAPLTVTLQSDVHSRLGINGNGLTLNGNNFYIYGGSLINVTNTAGGTTVYRISGTGSGSNVNLNASTTITNTIVMNTPGTATISGNFLFGGTTFTYTAGILVANFGFTLNTSTSTTLTMPPQKFLTVTFAINNATYTLLSDFTMTTFANNGAFNLTFTGSNVWITDIFTQQTGGGATLTLQAGLTYSILKQINISPLANYVNNYSIISGASGSYANLYLAPGATQTMYSVYMKDINNVGTPLWIYNPTLVNTTNVWTLNYLSPQQTTITTT